jgi:acetyl-CoA carboxylase biotin carboxyl carrier protein
VSLSAKDVAEIMKLLEDSVFEELSLETEGLKLRLRKSGAGPSSFEEAAPPPKVVEAPKTHPQPSLAPASTPTMAGPGVTDVPAPLLGVFYRAPKPGEAAFVEVGDVVEEDTVICIIEVMKLMNSVRAGVKGEVVEILAQNGNLVEYGETLIRVRQTA